MPSPSAGITDRQALTIPVRWMGIRAELHCGLVRREGQILHVIDENFMGSVHLVNRVGMYSW